MNNKEDGDFIALQKAKQVIISEIKFEHFNLTEMNISKSTITGASGDEDDGGIVASPPGQGRS